MFGDIRDFPPELLDGVDAVVHLAAVSNDPMGNKFEAVTDEINQQASVRMAELAAERGVKNFVFASSCSMYGYAEGGARKETDPTNPLTAYARSKIGSEKAFAQLDLGGMTVTSLRFATACGMSDRLRLDLVLNDFVACALASGEITVLSDGTPWRPLIDVEDMARAIVGDHPQARRTAGSFWRSMPAATSAIIRCATWPRRSRAQAPGTKVSINTNAPPDKRSYKVDFSLFRSLAPATSAGDAGSVDRGGCARGCGMGFADKDFRNSPFMRLKTLERHMAAGRLGRGPALASRWLPRAAA